MEVLAQCSGVVTLLALEQLAKPHSRDDDDDDGEQCTGRDRKHGSDFEYLWDFAHQPMISRSHFRTEFVWGKSVHKPKELDGCECMSLVLSGLPSFQMFAYNRRIS